MLLGGLQKTTLIDFPGRVACTVFTVGCNFRCPFCHNKDLVVLRDYKNKRIDRVEEEEFFEFLKKRKKLLDGVCITGGEPTLQQDLIEFCQKIKKLDLEVKLDTNGSNPSMLERLIERELVDFIAMDVKTTFSEYGKAVGINVSTQERGNGRFWIGDIKQSIKLILKSSIEYEFRTTVVPGIHNKKNLVKLARQLVDLSGGEQLNWTLQKFRPQNCLDPAYLKIIPFSDEQMKVFLKLVQKVLPEAKLREES